MDGYDLVYNELKFTGAPARTLKTHNIAGQASVVELYTYDYDKAQRPTTTKYSLNGGGEVTLASNTYDDLGRVSTKNRHNGADPQSYVYNIRNWPTKITSGTFEENLYYNSNLPSDATANYNGNIAYSTWTYNGVNKGYSYVYDGLNRLTAANFKQGSSSQSNDSFNESFVFDKMGNILTLQRKSNNTLVDDLTLHYTNGEKSNQLEWINDSKLPLGLNSVKEYQNSSTATSNEFAYDANGNMTKDLDRNIVAIRYNILNLPDVVQFKNGNQIKNSYNAGGQKLGTEYFTQLTNITPLVDGQIVSQSYNPGTVDQIGNTYIGNVEYTTQNGNSSLTALSRIYNAEGYAENMSNPQYYYYRKDHLGDNREVWLANTGETVQRTQYYPSGLPWASNSGDNPGKQQRKYNGKEFVEMHGYDTYDYGARGYYAAIGGWPTVDPLAEKKPWMSPYVYCSGNPVNRIDPDGRDDTSGTPSKKNKDGVDTTPQSTTAVKVPKKIEPTEMTKEQKANVLFNSEGAKASKGTLKEWDRMAMTPEDKAVAKNPLVQGAAVVAAAPAVAAAGDMAILATEGSNALLYSTALVEGISKAITNAPPDTPYLSEVSGYKVAVDIVNQAATLVLNFFDKKNSTNTTQSKPNGKK